MRALTAPVLAHAPWVRSLRSSRAAFAWAALAAG
jgi:hypothetical protein